VTSRDGGGAPDTGVAEHAPPGPPSGSRVAFPRPSIGPLVQVGWRLLMALPALAVTVLLDHDDPETARLRSTDRLITICRAADGPAAAPLG
jgi:hypothetical protein